MKVGFFYF